MLLLPLSASEAIHFHCLMCDILHPHLARACHEMPCFAIRPEFWIKLSSAHVHTEAWRQPRRRHEMRFIIPVRLMAPSNSTIRITFQETAATNLTQQPCTGKGTNPTRDDPPRPKASGVLMVRLSTLHLIPFKTDTRFWRLLWTTQPLAAVLCLSAPASLSFCPALPCPVKAKYLSNLIQAQCMPNPSLPPQRPPASHATPQRPPPGLSCFDPLTHFPHFLPLPSLLPPSFSRSPLLSFLPSHLRPHFAVCAKS